MSGYDGSNSDPGQKLTSDDRSLEEAVSEELSEEDREAVESLLGEGDVDLDIYLGPEPSREGRNSYSSD